MQPNPSLQRIIRQHGIIVRLNLIPTVILFLLVCGSLFNRSLDPGWELLLANIFYQIFMLHWMRARVQKWYKKHASSYEDASNGE